MPTPLEKKLMLGLRVLGGLSGLACSIIGIVGISTVSFNPRSIVNFIYMIIFGAVIIVCEARIKVALKHFYFLQHFFGLGAFYLFLGGVCLGGTWYYVMIACFLLGVGIIYMVLGCMCRTMENEFGENPGAGRRPPSSSSDGSAEPSRVDGSYAAPSNQWGVSAANSAIDSAQKSGGMSSWEAHVAKAAVPSAIQGMRAGANDAAGAYGAW